jgi:hypothetical protein
MTWEAAPAPADLVLDVALTFNAANLPASIDLETGDASVPVDACGS